MNPVFVEGQDLENLKRQVEEALKAAQSSRSQIDRNLPDWRRALALESRENNAYEDAPSLTTPTTRGRRDAVVAHMLQAVDRSPLFVAIPKTPDATEVIRPLEAFMEHELSLYDNHQKVLDGVTEAIDVGTGTLKAVVEQVGNGEFAVRVDSVPLEDVYYYPTGTIDMALVNVFERVRLPYYVLRFNAQEGFFDAEAVEAVGKTLQEDSRTAGQKQAGTDDGSSLDASEFDWKPVTFWEIWLRWRGDLLQIHYHEEAGILRAIPNPLPVDRPPYQPVTGMPIQRSIYGDSLAKLLASLQDAEDAAFNAILAEMEFVSSPVVITTDDELFVMLNDVEYSPGQTYIASKPLTQENFQILQHQLNPGTLSFLQVVDRQAEVTSFSNMQIPGLPTPGDRTATEASIVASAGTAKLKMMLTRLSMGVDKFANLYWQLIKKFRVNSLQAIFTSESFVLLGRASGTLDVPDEENDLEVRKQIAAFFTEHLGVDPQTTQQVLSQIPVQTRQIKVVSVDDDRVLWKLNGGDTIPEKQLRRQQIMEVLQLVPLLPAAAQDRRVYELVKELLQAMDIPNMDKILGKPPENSDDAALQQALQTLVQMRTRARGGAGEERFSLVG